MNIVLYLDSKSFCLSPDYMVKSIKDTHIKGFEVSIDINSDEDKIYLETLARLCKENDLILQIHARMNDDVETQLDYFGNIAKIYGKLNILNHPISSDNIYLSQEKTNKMFAKILYYIKVKKYDIEFGVENLASRKGSVRLSKNMLLPILVNNEDLKFTYNIGNEFRDFNKVNDVNPLFLNRMNNIHIYSFDYKNIHKPIIKDELASTNILKELMNLKSTLFDGTLVLDYDFDLLGMTASEKLENYIANAEEIYKILHN